MTNDTVMVLTARSVERMVNEGGSQAWRLVPANAREMKYVVCTRNKRAHWGDGNEAHRNGFLVAKIESVVASPERPVRFLIRFSEYARIDVPELWRKGDRNPVRYCLISEFGIDPSKLKWEQMPADQPESLGLKKVEKTHLHVAKPLTISEAKHGLALAFNVALEAVEITIRA